MTDMTPSQQQQQQQQQRQQPLSLSLSSFSFFERVNDVDTLSPDDFLDRFEKYGFLWFKGTSSSSSSTKGETILNFIQEHAVACEKSWTVENHGNGSSSSSSSIRGRDSSGNSGNSGSNGNKKKMKQITTLSPPPPRIVTPQTLCNFT